MVYINDKIHNYEVFFFLSFQYTVDGGKPQPSDTLPTEINGIQLELRGSSLFFVNISKISLTMTYTGQDYSWGLKVPYSVYHDRTEGLCGKSRTRKLRLQRKVY